METNPGPEMELFITNVFHMRNSQIRYANSPSRSNANDKRFYEYQVDQFLEKQMALRELKGRIRN